GGASSTASSRRRWWKRRSSKRASMGGRSCCAGTTTRLSSTTRSKSCARGGAPGTGDRSLAGVIRGAQAGIHRAVSQEGTGGVDRAVAAAVGKRVAAVGGAVVVVVLAVGAVGLFRHQVRAHAARPAVGRAGKAVAGGLRTIDLPVAVVVLAVAAA